MTPTINTSGMEFEVFLSFRGPDTRDNFTSCLHSEMVEKGIGVFKDDEELRVGQEIGGNLLRALDNTQIYIPIFSKGFASSPWCLREVAHMVDCTSKSDGKKEILPIFFDVEPDDVKLKTELYKNALSKHEESYDRNEVKRWEAALVEVPTRVGWKLAGKGYGELIKLIVRELLLKLKGKNRPLPDHLVETDDLKHIEKMLDVDSNDHVRFLVIHGMGGTGKSTLASVIFNRFWSKFNCSSFLDDVPRQGLLDVQKKLLSDTLGSTSADGIHDPNDGIDRIRRGLGNKKVLLVVDNVDEKRQLEYLAGRCDWFGSGSRIIITVRDKSTVLDKDNQTPPSNYLAYSVMEMPIDQAIQLFSKHAFKSGTPSEGWYNFSKRVVSSIGRLPLTLEVVGSLFANTVRSEWDETLEDLKKVPHRQVRNTLMISIKKLDDIEKAIFLDIACFCIGENKTYADYMWRSTGYSPRSAIDVLLLMSLIKIDDCNCLWMHDEVRDLGRYIVMEENLEDSTKRRWVWIDENTLDILRSNEEKGAVRALSLGISHDFTPEEIDCWPKLRFLGGERLNFVGDFKDLLPNLRWLSWHDCPRDISATNLHMENLVVLNLSGSRITHDWGGWRQIKMAKRLKILDLSQCYELTRTPDFSELGKLEKLILIECENLSTIDSSIGKLKRLSTLNIYGCTSLGGLPEEIGSLECLSEIIMPSFGDLFKLPETLGNLKSLTKFTILSHPGIIQLPHSIGKLNLTHLVLVFCKNLHELPSSIGELESLIKLELKLWEISVLPDSIGKLKNLKHLLLSECEKLYELPDSIGELESLVDLDLKQTGISVLPDSIGRLKNLKLLVLSECKNLHELPDSIGELESLVDLDLKLTGISALPDSIGRLKNLKHLLLSECKKLHELPDSIGELESLAGLDLEASGIFVLPDSIGRLKNFKHIILSECKNLHELPDSIGELKSLVSLNLEFSGIFVLPDSIGRLKNLKYLLLAECKNLCELPDSIGKLGSLVGLDLEASGIFVLPNSIGRLRNLKHLLLSECKNLHKLPDSIGKLKSLEDLKLKLPGISILPDSIGMLTSFTHLSFSGCENLLKLPDSIGKMELLVELDLIFSGISLLPDSIGNLKRLKYLRVAYTKIRTIPCALGRVATLEVLDASFCPLLMDEIPWEMWSLTNMRTLNLEGSPISTVPRNISGFSSLETLKIAGNRLSLLPELPSSLKWLVVAATECPSFAVCLVPRLPDLSRLKSLEVLQLSHFPELVEIPGLGELESLKFLHLTVCDAIEQLPNLSRLTNLQRLEIKHCAKLRAVEGLQELKNLENADIRWCMSLERSPDVSAFTKLETDWMPLEEQAEHAIQQAKRLRLSLDWYGRAG